MSQQKKQRRQSKTRRWRSGQECRFETTFPDAIQERITSTPHLGDGDAVVEWEAPERTRMTFLDTSAYEEFKRVDLLYLFGRKGTGKTAIMRMLGYDICHHDVPDYCTAWTINQEKVYLPLTSQIRGGPLADLDDAELVSFLVDQWRWVFSVAAMMAIWRDYSHSQDVREELEPVHKFLEEEDLASATDDATQPIRRLTQIISNHIEEAGRLSTMLAAVLTRISRQQMRPMFLQAEAALSHFLTERNRLCVVLIDSPEVYKIEDPIFSAAMSSMIIATRYAYIERASKRVLVKVSFPAELYPHMSINFYDKMEGKILFISWRNSDLLCVVAKRLYYLMNNEETIPAWLNKPTQAREYLYRHLPPSTTVRQGFQFDTFAYIIAHTQKKPRQAIHALNVILTVTERNGEEWTSISEDSVRRGIHARLETLFRGTFDVYGQLFKNAERLVRRTLHRAHNHLTPGDLDMLIKETASLRKESSVSIEELKRLLLESGVIGVIDSFHTIRGSNKRLAEVVFEYQVKGVLTISNTSKLALHQMVYQQVVADVDLDTFFYPKPYEAEERQLLEDLGILLR